MSYLFQSNRKNFVLLIFFSFLSLYNVQTNSGDKQRSLNPKSRATVRDRLRQEVFKRDAAAEKVQGLEGLGDVIRARDQFMRNPHNYHAKRTYLRLAGETVSNFMSENSERLEGSERAVVIGGLAMATLMQIGTERQIAKESEKNVADAARKQGKVAAAQLEQERLARKAQQNKERRDEAEAQKKADAALAMLAKMTMDPDEIAAQEQAEAVEIEALARGIEEDEAAARQEGIDKERRKKIKKQLEHSAVAAAGRDQGNDDDSDSPASSRARGKKKKR